MLSAATMQKVSRRLPVSRCLGGAMNGGQFKRLKYDWATIGKPDGAITNGQVAVVGFPTDVNSSFLQGPSKAPQRIREAYKSDSGNLFSESFRDTSELFHDVGDVKDLVNMSAKDNHQAITQAITELLEDGHKVLSLGGDHSITYPVVEAYSKVYPKLRILHFDAHCDLYENFENNKYSHASPFARILEHELITKLASIGIRTSNPHQKEQAKQFGVKIMDMKTISKSGIYEVAHQLETFARGHQLYVSIDIDVLDPAFAPGVSHHEPGGMSVRDLLTLVQTCKGDIVGADVVELNPDRDFNDMTASAAQKIFKELICKMTTPTPTSARTF